MRRRNILIAAVLAVALSLSSVSLFACGGSSSSSSAASSQATSSASQDNCYGDDLPKVNK